VLRVLRLGAYQLLRLRVPARAAVSEAVELARAEAPRAAGFVNAVLRRLAREGAPPLPDAAHDPLEWLTSEGSLPAWLAGRWLERLGPGRAIARARAFLDAPPVVFRLNPRAKDAERRMGEAGLAPRGLVVPGALEATAGRIGPLAAEGVLYVQDQGSQLIAHLAAHGAPEHDARALDACAAPGGKATLLADLLGPRARIVAGEVSARRLSVLAHLARHWGAQNVRAVGADALQPPFRAPFDAVLLDAPCSGLGTIGRHPDLRWRVQPADIARHTERQRAMLERLAPLVRPGGRLVYAVCSAEREENEDVLEPFLDVHPEFQPGAIPGWADAFREGVVLRTLPERDRGDAFFAAPLQRR
jgi:16S rRNA (cytosine967-C5)-methyltransferase